MKQNGTQMVLRSIPWRPPHGPAGLKMGQEVPRWPQGGPKRPPRTPQMAQRWPKMAPRDHNVAPRGTKMAPKGPKMAPRWPQDGPKRPPKGPSWVPNWYQYRKCHFFKKRCFSYVFFNKNGLPGGSKWLHFGAL